MAGAASPWGTRQRASRSHSRNAGLPQALTQSVELMAVARCARRVAAQGLTHLRRTGQAQYGTWCLVKLQAGRFKRQVAEAEKPAYPCLGLRHQCFIWKIQHPFRISFDPETRQP